jgi:hypothetical protein
MDSATIKSLFGEPMPADNRFEPERYGSTATIDESDMLDALAVLVEHTPVAIAMFDRQMRYILANRQWVKEFNLSQALPLVGKSQYEVFPKLHPGWKHLYERTLQGYTMRSDHAVQVATGAAPVLFRCEARPWRQKRDASVAGIVVICNKIVGNPIPDTIDSDNSPGIFSSLKLNQEFDSSAFLPRAQTPVSSVIKSIENVSNSFESCTPSSTEHSKNDPPDEVHNVRLSSLLTRAKLSMTPDRLKASSEYFDFEQSEATRLLNEALPLSEGF